VPQVRSVDFQLERTGGCWKPAALVAKFASSRFGTGGHFRLLRVSGSVRHSTRGSGGRNQRPDRVSSFLVTGLASGGFTSKHSPCQTRQDKRVNMHTLAWEPAQLHPTFPTRAEIATTLLNASPRGDASLVCLDTTPRAGLIPITSSPRPLVPAASCTFGPTANHLPSPVSCRFPINHKSFLCQHAGRRRLWEAKHAC
jgi:hypothetical protein